ncbi:translation initiation factor [Rhodopirellula sp. MGV]|uniref:translation initiation factor n=1 Tax=Rhodopirellula sp. MGV TaxID=2023130 RepID=UPI000B969C79|nr:translation initiation factor [Rhodopirellula sp. MGV]OYP34926.1 translation initiation factor [Rhodopirellula sp. MGV]PNY38177.1 translation initiation factor [Rhodopirellula baltica]
MASLFAGTQFYIPPTCERCGKTEDECVCTAEEKAADEAAKQKQANRLPPEKQTARVQIEKRKGGRKATVISGLTAQANDLQDLLAQLQTVCGTGGTVKSNDDLVELQGDHAEAIRKKLAEIGYRVK